MPTVCLAGNDEPFNDANGTSKSTPKSTVPPLDRPLPQVADIDRTTAASQRSLIDAAVESLKVSGACLVRNAVSMDVLNEIETDIRPHIDAAVAWKGEKGDFYPSESRRVTACISKSQAYAIHLVGHPIWQAICEILLTSHKEWFWVGDKNEQSISKPQLNNTIVFSMLPGARNQGLHRDDNIHYNHQPAAAIHHLGRDSGATIFFAAKTATKANGATRFIPGSHLWDYSVPPPRCDDARNPQIKYAELSPGDAFIMLHGCYHGASANITRDEERLIYSASTVRGWYRQEENQFLANNVAMIRKLPPELQRFAGFRGTWDSLGWVNFDDPIKAINGEKAAVVSEDVA